MHPDADHEFTRFQEPENFSCPETRELAENLRQLGRLLPSGAPIDRQESRRRCRDVLQELSRTDRNRRLLERVERRAYEIGGDEHQLFQFEDEPGRIYKATYQDSFGCHSAFDPLDPELTGKQFNATLSEDPRFYLRRWILLNELGDYKTRFEGILPPERAQWMPRICVSQPWLEGTNPSSHEISLLMAKVGFVEVSRDAFYLPEARVLLTDCAPRNVRILSGKAIPFDAIAESPSAEVSRWLAEKIPI